MTTADGRAPAAPPPSLRAAFEHAPLGMVLLDGDGRIVATNRAACVLLDARACELVGTMLSSRAHPDDIGGASRERRYRREDGSILHVHELAGAIPESDPPLSIVTLEDVTQRQLAIERLRTQTALAYLGEMASVIAHEVRNAFAGIRGAVEVIGQDLPQGSEEREAVDHVRRRIGGLEETVDDLLRFARLRPPSIAPVCIREALGEVSRALSLSAPFASLVVAGPDLVVQADRELLVCALGNVCSSVAEALSASRSTEDGAVVCIDVAPAGEVAELRVSGQGGVPGLHEVLLRPFFMSRAAAGLPIAKRILDAQGADLRIEDAGDCTVVVRMLLAPRSPCV